MFDFIGINWKHFGMFSSRQIFDLLSLIEIVANVRCFAAKNSLRMKVDQNHEPNDTNCLAEYVMIPNCFVERIVIMSTAMCTKVHVIFYIVVIKQVDLNLLIDICLD